jgi:hypothetical protein
MIGRGLLSDAGLRESCMWVWEGFELKLWGVAERVNNHRNRA